MPSNGPNIAFSRVEFNALLPLWKLIRDCVAGEERVKAGQTLYLPAPNPTDTSAENVARYAQYVQRAVFYNVTGRTLAGLVGQVMSEDPVITLPTLLEPLREDIGGCGVSMTQQMAKALMLVTAHGRAGLFTDYPVVERPATRKELLNAEVRPTIELVEPWDIINWRTINVGGVSRLSLVVLSEQYVTDDDGYEIAWDRQWRVMRLDEEGLYVLEEWITDPNNKDEYIVKPLYDTNGGVVGKAQYMPVGSDGKRLDFIPFQFIGANNNDSSPDMPPLFGLASLNIAHYRNSADYEEACFICGQPTLLLAGLTEDWVKSVLKGRVELGSRAAVMLNEGASGELLQATPNSMPKEAMEAKERQMVALGAKIVEQMSVQRTATQVTMDKTAETSVLASIANNVSEAYECAMKHALAFVDITSMDTEDIIEVELNTSFTASKMEPQARAQLVAEWQAGLLTDEEVRTNLVRAGVASEEFDEWNDKRETQVLTRPVAPSTNPLDKPPEDKAVGKDKGAKA